MTKTFLAAAATTALLCLSNPAVAAPAQAAEASQPARFSVEVIGKGPDVILIPGLSTPREVWRPTAEALKATHRVHLIQIRGFGDPAGVNATGAVLKPSVTELAAYAARLKHPAVIGHSLGGLAALQLAARYPGAAGRIMVVDALPFIGTLFDPAATVTTVAPRADAMRQGMLARAAAAKGQPTPALRDCSAVTGETPYRPGTMAVGARANCQIGNWMQQSDPAVVAQAMYDDFVSDERQSIARIAVPLTVTYAFDQRQPKELDVDALYRTAYAKAPKARLVAIAGSAHFIMLDQPERLLAAIRTFLK